MKGNTVDKNKKYEMVYICLNCGYKLHKEFPYGEEAPHIGGFKEIPDECPYCGCIHFSNPFRPDDPRAK